MQPLLELQAVTKGYGTGAGRTEVLSNINLQVRPGEFVAIVGYSGAGKTTLISLMAGLIPADSGRVLLNGRPIVGPAPDRAIVFQNYSLLPWLSVFDNVYLSVDQVFPQWDRRQKQEQVERYLAMVNLTAARLKKPAQLSGGMRQRVSVARALAMEPQVLLLDEPLGALDALTRATLQDEIERIWRQHRRTVVLITNDVDEGILLADRIVPLSAGPRATLGPSVTVDLDRPRERKAINHCPQFKRIRRDVFDYLLGAGGKQAQAARQADKASQHERTLPELRPRDLSLKATFASRLRRCIPNFAASTAASEVEQCA